jgi:hypothetical protein
MRRWTEIDITLGLILKVQKQGGSIIDMCLNASGVCDTARVLRINANTMLRLFFDPANPRIPKRIAGMRPSGEVSWLGVSRSPARTV